MANDIAEKNPAKALGWLTIKYEELVLNPKLKIKELLKSCELSWNENCLKFYNNKRLIKTASDTQARKKIYKTSIDSWKYYKKFLGKNFQKKLN